MEQQPKKTQIRFALSPEVAENESFGRLEIDFLNLNLKSPASRSKVES